jgi:hypothetical protein
MATNKLMEAAADILAGSKKSASGEPMNKADAQVVDLGGPTNQNSKPMDDSAKIDAAKAIKGKAAAPTTKPSDASSKMEDTEVEDEILDEMDKSQPSQERHGNRPLGAKGTTATPITGEKVVKDSSNDFEKAFDKEKQMKKKMKEDVDALFADDSTISEEFKSKVSTIFEARVADRVSQIEEETEAKYAGMLEEAVESIRADLTEKVDDYLSYVVEQWMKDNEIAIESGLRSELTEDFIAGMRNLFAEHYIDVPAEKVDLVDELAGKVEELESKLNEEIERAVDLKKSLVESRKVEMTREVCEGLTDTQVEKIKSLAESVEFSTEDEYKQKLETIRENYFPSNAKKATEAQLHEEFEEEEAKKVINDPFVAAVSQAISKTKI